MNERAEPETLWRSVETPRAGPAKLRQMARPEPAQDTLSFPPERRSVAGVLEDLKLAVPAIRVAESGQ